MRPVNQPTQPAANPSPSTSTILATVPLGKRGAQRLGAEERYGPSSGPERCGTEPAVADHIASDSLLEVHGGREEHGEVVVAVRVDEAGCEGEASRVDLDAGALSREVSHRG